MEISKKRENTKYPRLESEKWMQEMMIPRETHTELDTPFSRE